MKKFAAKLKHHASQIVQSFIPASFHKREQENAQKEFEALPPKDQALVVLLQGRKIGGPLRRRAMRALGTPVPDVRITRKGKPAAEKVDSKDVRITLLNKFNRASWAQLLKWHGRLSRRLPQVNRALDAAKGAGMVKTVDLLQVKADQMTTVKSALEVAIKRRKILTSR